MTSNAAARRTPIVTLSALLLLLTAAAGPVRAAAAQDAAAGGGADLASRLERSELPVLVEFWAPWCAPCRRLEKPLAELAREMDGKVRVMRVNFDRSPRAAQRYGVELLPTLVVFDRGGVELDRLTGVPDTAELRSRLAQLVAGETVAAVAGP